MKKLHEYETPLTEKAHKGRRDRYLGGTVDYFFAADLERKLALAMDALMEIEGMNSIRHPLSIAENALREIENENPQG